MLPSPARTESPGGTTARDMSGAARRHGLVASWPFLRLTTLGPTWGTKCALSPHAMRGIEEQTSCDLLYMFGHVCGVPSLRPDKALPAQIKVALCTDSSTTGGWTRSVVVV